MHLGEEPGKQKTRSCRAQELARSSAQENERQKKVIVELRRMDENDRNSSQSTGSASSSVFVSRSREWPALFVTFTHEGFPVM